MLSDCDLVAFLATTDLDRARVFFSDVIGLRLVEDTPFASVFDAHGTLLRVTPVAEAPRLPYTVLGWTVVDLPVVARGLAERGAVFERFAGMEQDELGVWNSPSGDLVAWFKDPDGNLLSLSQPRGAL